MPISILIFVQLSQLRLKYCRLARSESLSKYRMEEVVVLCFTLDFT